MLGHELIGAWSDKCTSKLGRRRPFIIIGSVLVCISLFCVGYAKEISRLLTSDEDNEVCKKGVLFYDKGFIVVDETCRQGIISWPLPLQYHPFTFWIFA